MVSIYYEAQLKNLNRKVLSLVLFTRSNLETLEQRSVGLDLYFPYRPLSRVIECPGYFNSFIFFLDLLVLPDL